MLDAEGKELAERLSRICVARTEDYILLKEIKHTIDHLYQNFNQKDAQLVKNARYFYFLLKEFESREKWRTEKSKMIISELLPKWENSILQKAFNENNTSYLYFLSMQKTILKVYIESCRLSYLLNFYTEHNSENWRSISPFAEIEASRFLYYPSTLQNNNNNSSIATLLQAVHQTIFDTKRDPNNNKNYNNNILDLLNTLYPVSTPPTTTNSNNSDTNNNNNNSFLLFLPSSLTIPIKESTRTFLYQSRLMWLHLFLLFQQSVCWIGAHDITEQRELENERLHPTNKNKKNSVEEERRNRSAFVKHVLGHAPSMAGDIFLTQQQSSFTKVLTRVMRLSTELYNKVETK